MKPLVLGLNSTHPDASAVLANENGIIAAIAEERINRVKHCGGFPKLAINEVLRLAGARIEDVTDIAFARQPRANIGAKLAFIAKNPAVGFSVAKFRMEQHRKNSGGSFAEQLGVREDQIKAQFHNVEHHLTHIASAFFCSGYERATGISIDGAGDFCTVMLAKCEGNKIDVFQRSHPPHSLGVFYSSVCAYLGFDKFGEEYKVMGLAAYGQDRYAEEFKKLCWYDPAKGVRLNQDYFDWYKKMMDRDAEEAGLLAKDGELRAPSFYNENLVKLLGPVRKRGTPLTQRDNDMAASMQAHFERVYLDIMKHATAKTGCRDLVMAGGCALNGVANGKAVMQGLCDKIYIHPAAADDGTAAGAALYVLHAVRNVPRTPQMEHAYWGTGWSDEEIAKDVASATQGLKFTRLTPEQTLSTAADAIARGKITGWFQGREEWGPRALGNRSILCNPGWPDMKAILNARIKNREHFRPFAPAVLHERLGELYDGSHEVPFMNIVYTTRPEWRERLSAVTHEDNTGRVQTVKRTQNQRYYDLIRSFSEKSGIPVLLNTSFNENEPIVHTPAQAIACFARTKMDCLAVGNFWCEKPAEVAAKAEVISAEFSTGR